MDFIFPIILGMSSSQLTFIFFGGVETLKPPIRYSFIIHTAKCGIGITHERLEALQKYVPDERHMGRAWSWGWLLLGK